MNNLVNSYVVSCMHECQYTIQTDMCFCNVELLVYSGTQPQK